jgi:hypothetical protein
MQNYAQTKKRMSDLSMNASVFDIPLLAWQGADSEQ